MKKIFSAVLSLMTLSQILYAQQTIKVGETKTLICNGTFINEVQFYFSDGKPSSIGKCYVENKKDSVVFFNLYAGSKETENVIFRFAIAKKDIDTGDSGFEIEKTIENTGKYQLLKIKTRDGNSVISEIKYSGDEEEMHDPTNRVFIYFEETKEADAKLWAEKIKKMIQ